jgi:hypothetical protein
MQMPRLDESADYVIKVQGHLDASLADWFGPLNVVPTVGEGEQVITILSGTLADQAGLLGLIRHLHGLGVVLLSIERVTHSRR